MFSKILIANRGEIACRVIKSARKMGISTVAIYSDADKQALHVQMADEAVHIGPPPANQSYIVIDKVMEAIRASGAQAVHPGYGFLSENASFAKMVAENGITFIGPGVKAIEIMGSKLAAKGKAKRTIKQNSREVIGDNITVTVVRITGGGVRLGIEAPPNCNVVRKELVESLVDMSQAAAAHADDPRIKR